MKKYKIFVISFFLQEEFCYIFYFLYYCYFLSKFFILLLLLKNINMFC